MNQEISNLARFISVIKFRPIMWRQNHSYVLCDRIEDLTDPAQIETEPKSDRKIALYGFMRGANMNPSNQVHIPGVGDFTPTDVAMLPDPCPLPKTIKKRSLNQKERLVYAPLTGHGGLLYDKDAVYLDTEIKNDEKRDGDDLLDKLRNPELAELEDVNNVEESGLTLVKGGMSIARRAVPDQKIVFNELSEDENVEESDEEIEAPEGMASDSETDDEPMEVNEEDAETIRQIQKEIEGNEEEDEEDVSEFRWKDGMHERASSAFYSRQNSSVSLKQIVYGDVKQELEKKSEDQSEVGGLFIKIMEKSTNLDERDETVPIQNEMIQDKEKIVERIEELRAQIKDFFVTGDWGDDDATRLLRDDDAFDDEELFGDFEDLEKSEADEVLQDDEGIDSASEEENGCEGIINEPSKSAKQKAYEKKMKLKEAFNREYDDKGDPTAGFFEEWKKETDEISARNKREFADLSDEARIEFEGYRAGLYVRIEFGNVPCELITHFEPKYPVLVGGLLPNEQKRGTLQLRVKRHRWFTRPVLKSRDPLIYSLGWRRFQAMPLYYMQDHNMRQRFLKYSPENMHCWAAMKAPVAPQGTGFLAIQKMDLKQPGFRLAATGTVLHQDHTAKVVKKLKLVGYPMKIFKNTAFVKDMFTSQIEAAKFEGAQVKTVSGIRGIIKKSLKSPEGVVRISFEDRILASDIIFCRTWASIQVPDLYLPVTNVLQAEGEKAVWKGMRNTGDIRKDKGIQPEVKQDSLYKPIERKKRVFHPLMIPKSLQKDLPFTSKPKDDKARVEGINKKRKLHVGKTVLREPKERKIKAMLNILGRAQNERDEKRKEQSRIRRENYAKKLLAKQKQHQRSTKDVRKRIYANLQKESSK